MQSLAEGLPADVAQQIHPNWRKNETEYWDVRDTLLAQYRDQWIGFADRTVIASGSSPVAVFHEAARSGRHPFVTCVGREHEPCHMRRAEFAYDSAYPAEALPLLTVEFRSKAGSPGVVFDRVIPDTGADASALPWADCQRMQLDTAVGTPGLMGGVAQSVAATIVFSVWVHLDGTTQSL